jgi:hypothetical protein
MLQEAKRALTAWIERLAKGEARQVLRPILKVPLPPENVKEGTKRFGDLRSRRQKLQFGP